MNSLTILKFSPRKPRASEIQPKDIKGAINLISEIVIQKIKKGEINNAQQ